MISCEFVICKVVGVQLLELSSYCTQINIFTLSLVSVFFPDSISLDWTCLDRSLISALASTIVVVVEDQFVSNLWQSFVGAEVGKYLSKANIIVWFRKVPS